MWFGGYAFLLVVTAAAVLLAHEWLAMCGFTASQRIFFWLPALFVVVAVAAGEGQAGAALLVLAVGGLGAWSWRPRADADPGRSAQPGQSGWLAFGAFYIGLSAVALPWLRADPVVGLANTLFALVIVWASDIGAYIVGRLIGGPKLAPAISPGKTWSGALGGLICAPLAALAVAAAFSSEIPFAQVMLLGLGLGIVSQAGDLLESGLKRHFGVKDSGRIIPGHGGLLDRVDALLAVAPVAALLAYNVGRGVVLWR